MRSYLVLLSALVIICDGTLSAQQPQDQPTPAFRAGVDVVSLNVTVSDLDGRFITNLDQTNFQVYEDGVQQNVTFFTRTQLPIALAMLIDTSASMDEKLATAQEAAIGFSQRLRPEDLVEIVDFDSRVNILQTFTNDAVKLEQAIQQTSAGGSTSLYNAIYISLRELSKAPLRRADVIFGVYPREVNSAKNASKSPRTDASKTFKLLANS